MINKIIVIFLSLALGISSALFYVSYNKLNYISNYNHKENEKNKSILEKNNKYNGSKKNNINILKNYSFYNDLYSIEEKKILKNKCDESFDKKYNLLIIKASEDYYKYNFYKLIELKYKDKLSYSTKKYFLEPLLGTFGYQINFSNQVKEYNTSNFLKYKILIKNNNKKFSYSKKGIPTIEGIEFSEYLRYLKQYKIKDIERKIKRIKVGDAIVFLAYKPLTEIKELEEVINNSLGKEELINIYKLKYQKEKEKISKILFTNKQKEEMEVCKRLFSENIESKYKSRIYNILLKHQNDF